MLCEQKHAFGVRSHLLVTAFPQCPSSGQTKRAALAAEWRRINGGSSRNGTLDIPVTWQHTAGIHTSKNARYGEGGGGGAPGRPLLTALRIATTAVKSQLKTKLARCEVLVNTAGLTVVFFVVG